MESDSDSSVESVEDDSKTFVLLRDDSLNFDWLIKDGRCRKVNKKQRCSTNTEEIQSAIVFAESEYVLPPTPPSTPLERKASECRKRIRTRDDLLQEYVKLIIVGREKELSDEFRQNYSRYFLSTPRLSVEELKFCRNEFRDYLETGDLEKKLIDIIERRRNATVIAVASQPLFCVADSNRSKTGKFDESEEENEIFRNSEHSENDSSAKDDSVLNSSLESYGNKVEAYNEEFSDSENGEGVIACSSRVAANFNDDNTSAKDSSNSIESDELEDSLMVQQCRFHRFIESELEREDANNTFEYSNGYCDEEEEENVECQEVEEEHDDDCEREFPCNLCPPVCNSKSFLEDKRFFEDYFADLEETTEANIVSPNSKRRKRLDNVIFEDLLAMENVADFLYENFTPKASVYYQLKINEALGDNNRLTQDFDNFRCTRKQPCNDGSKEPKLKTVSCRSRIARRTSLRSFYANRRKKALRSGYRFIKEENTTCSHTSSSCAVENTKETSTPDAGDGFQWQKCQQSRDDAAKSKSHRKLAVVKLTKSAKLRMKAVRKKHGV